MHGGGHKGDSRGPRISVEEVDGPITEEYAGYREPPGEEMSEEGYQSDSSSSDETDDDCISTKKLFVEGENSIILVLVSEKNAVHTDILRR